MPSPRLRRLAVALGLLCGMPLAASASDQHLSPAAAISAESRAECEAGRRAATREERKARFEHGQALGEQAVTVDEHSAEAHFVLFCNMGELMRLDGESISSVFALRRLMAQLDRAIELDPHHADALAAKGTLLVRLPRLLGGDAVKGEAIADKIAEAQATLAELHAAR
jgi:hypothetical protein